MVRRRLPLIAILVFGLLGLVPGIASAALACPGTITHDTTLHADLDCTGVTSGNALTFAKPGLTLDLNGHTIMGYLGSDTAVGIYVAYNSDAIINGTIKNFGKRQIYAYGANQLTLNHLHLMGDGFNSSQGAFVYYGGDDTIKRNTSTGNYEGFEFEYSGGNFFAHNKMTNDYYGVYTYDDTDDRFVANNASGNEYGFYDDYSNGSLWRGNVANANYDGLYIDCDSYGNSLIIENIANQNSDDGIYSYECFYEYGGPSAPAVIRGNLANSNGSYGIQAEDPLNTVIVGNTTDKNQSDTGLYIEDNYTEYQVRFVANNVANNNNGWGIYADYFIPPSRSSDNHAGANTTQNCFNIVCV